MRLICDNEETISLKVPGMSERVVFGANSNEARCKEEDGRKLIEAVDGVHEKKVTTEPSTEDED